MEWPATHWAEYQGLRADPLPRRRAADGRLERIHAAVQVTRHLEDVRIQAKPRVGPIQRRFVSRSTPSVRGASSDVSATSAQGQTEPSGRLSVRFTGKHPKSRRS